MYRQKGHNFASGTHGPLWQLLFKMDASKMEKSIFNGAGKWHTPSGISGARKRGSLSLDFCFIKVKFNPLPVCRGRLLGCSHYPPLKHFTAARLDSLWLLLFFSLSVFVSPPEIKVWETVETACTSWEKSEKRPSLKMICMFSLMIEEYWESL